MIRSDGVVKLMDFGISHMVDLERLTVTGQLLGSPAYMAPEHVEGRPLDFRTDVFAAGIVLYQLTRRQAAVRGQEPARGAQADRRVQVRRSAPGEPADRQPARPDHPASAMAAEPADRYAAIGEMVLALEAYLEESGLPPTRSRRARALLRGAGVVRGGAADPADRSPDARAASSCSTPTTARPRSTCSIAC